MTLVQSTCGRVHCDRYMQVQFHAKGPTGAALISADMYQDDAKQWQWAFLYVDMTSPTPQRLILNGPSVPQY